MKLHRGAVKTCRYCEKTFAHTGNYKKHLAVHRKKLGLEASVDDVDITEGGKNCEEMTEEVYLISISTTEPDLC